jgi:hypothetical protein
MLPKLVLAASILSTYAHASSEVVWLQPQHTALIKLSTPGYPFWVLDGWFRQTREEAAVLLNFSMSADNHTLFVNGHAILPVEDSNRPPMITAHQVRDAIPAESLRTLAGEGLLRGELDQEQLQHRSFLELDYDRLVEADHETGPYKSHRPTLRFRIMGIGAYTTDKVLETEQQEVVHVTLHDENGKISADPKRNYIITQVEIKSVKDSYGGIHKGPEFDVGKECTKKSWACPDTGLYTPMAPYYRFIWRNKFDEFGRIGSFRHAVMKVISGPREKAILAFLMKYGTAALAGLIALVAYNLYNKPVDEVQRARDLAEKKLRAKLSGKYVDEDDGEDDWIAEHSREVGTVLTDKEMRQLNYIIPEE